jgi:hypothetical protein
MSLETSRLQVTGVTGGPLRITGATLVNGAYELATAGGADYELLTERQTTMDNILFIPGIANPVSEINQLLFGQGQQGTFIAPSLTASLISGSTFGSGVETLPDLSPRNNPFSQATPSSRGAWFREPKRGRVNLFERTEEIDNAYWTKTEVTLSQSKTVFGNIILTEVVENTANAFHRLQATLNRTSGVTYTVYCHVQAGEGARFLIINCNNFCNARSAFNLQTGQVAQVDTGTASIVDLGGGVFRCAVTGTASLTGSANVFFQLDPDSTEGAYTGDGTSSLFLGGFQLATGSTATAYQRVTTAFDVTESGQRDCFGVRADGIDDGYATAGNVDFSGTDKVTVFAAVRKLSDANTGVIAKLGTLTTQPGTFQLLGPGSPAANNYTATSVGDGTFRAVSASGLASPNTSIVTGISDILAPLIRIRVNGVVQGETNLSQGSGNYANDILTLFSRNNADRFFNGNLYALIVAGGSYPLSTIQRVERILSRITPTVNL